MVPATWPSSDCAARQTLSGSDQGRVPQHPSKPCPLPYGGLSSIFPRRQQISLLAWSALAAQATNATHMAGLSAAALGSNMGISLKPQPCFALKTHRFIRETSCRQMLEIRFIWFHSRNHNSGHTRRLHVHTPHLLPLIASFLTNQDGQRDHPAARSTAGRRGWQRTRQRRGLRSSDSTSALTAARPCAQTRQTTDFGRFRHFTGSHVPIVWTPICLKVGAFRGPCTQTMRRIVPIVW